MNKNWISIGTFFAGLLIAGIGFHLLSFSTDEKSPEKTYENYMNESYKVFSLPTPENVDFAGEKVPIEDVDVKERLDRELLVNTYWHSNTFLMTKRANRWFPVIEPILAENNIPDDFKYLALVESGLTNAVSPAGARGFWQFMKETARSYGLEVNSNIDERYHVEKSTIAACQYLQEAYDKYGSWSLAAASYNMGMGNLNKQIEKQKVDNYWDLLLNNETARYSYRILAVKEIMNNQAKYGFHIRDVDLYEPYELNAVKVDSSIEDLASWAMDQGINYKTLKLYNPWMRKGNLENNSGREYEILLPE